MPRRGTRTGDSVLGVFGTAPSYESFYSLFERAGTNVEQATALLVTMMADWPDDGPPVIRWKDIYERLEQAIDACRHVGNTLESLIVKLA